MMHGREKSDLAIVAMKPANKANEPTAEASTGANAAEPVERRAGAKGNAHQQSTHWTQSQARVSQALERIRQAIAVIHPRWEPYAGKPPVRFCAGGAMKIASLPLQRRERMMNPKCQTRPGFDTFSAKSAHLTGLKMRRITRAVSCVPMPRLWRGLFGRFAAHPGYHEGTGRSLGQS
jgi:hypothetical protein